MRYSAYPKERIVGNGLWVLEDRSNWMLKTGFSCCCGVLPPLHNLYLGRLFV